MGKYEEKQVVEADSSELQEKLKTTVAKGKVLSKKLESSPLARFGAKKLVSTRK